MLRFWRRDNGAILVEAAIVLPILVVLLLGMAEFGQAFSVRTRNNQVAGSIADLVAQSASVSNSDLGDISKIAQYLFAPYSSTPMGLRITSVIRNNNDTLTTQWSYGSGMTAYKGGDLVAVPDGLLERQETLIVVDTSYAYQPAVGMFLLGGVTFKSTAYFKPRLVPAVTRN